MQTLFARHPRRLDAPNAIIVDEFIELNLDGKGEAVSVMIGMLDDLREHGRACRFVKPLRGVPLLELKPSTRGGQRGGARIYFWITPDDAAGVVNCEVKEPDAPASRHKLQVALEVYIAHQRGVPVFDGPPATPRPRG